MVNRSFIDDYEQGATKVGGAIHGLAREELLSFPVPGTWSIQQVVLHLADAEQVLADRMKRIIAEENPTLLAFDETRWTKFLHYDLQSASEAATLIELVRKQMSRVLRALPDAAFARVGIHSEAGPLSLQTIVEKATKHVEHHLKFIIEKREKLGK
jgi:hypothetical protein